VGNVREPAEFVVAATAGNAGDIDIGVVVSMSDFSGGGVEGADRFEDAQSKKVKASPPRRRAANRRSS
jgi:hypothetical protein